MAHDKGFLSSPEYSVMCQWYEFIENNVDIGLDLIGRYIILFDYIVFLDFSKIITFSIYFIKIVVSYIVNCLHDF